MWIQLHTRLNARAYKAGALPSCKVFSLGPLMLTWQTDPLLVDRHPPSGPSGSLLIAFLRKSDFVKTSPNET
ncbi:MAG: hypothetical protein ACFFB3_13445 [Candidatus Hodarchaeota archaeon]